MSHFFTAFLLLAVIGLALLLSGINLLAGTGWTLVAAGAAVLGLSGLFYRAFYR